MDHTILRAKYFDTDIGVCRCGYTGEDGFELSIQNNKIEQLYDILLKV